MYQTIIIATCLCLVTHVSETARILVVIPTPNFSHQVVFRPLIHELVKRGHHVTYITTDPIFPKGKAPPNLTEIDFHDISYQLWNEKVLTGAVITGKKSDIISQVRAVYEVMVPIVEKLMEQPEMKTVLSSEYDLLMIEGWPRAGLMFRHVFKVPTIIVSSLGGINTNYNMMGAPSMPFLLYPTYFRQRLVNLSLWDKIRELYGLYLLQNIYDETDALNEVMMRKFLGRDTPTIKELEKDVDMLFLNVHSMWEMNRPIPPGIVYIGGIHLNPPKELPKELKDYLDSSKHGVIYMSYGTNASPSQLPREKIQILTAVFSKLKYDILWKWDSDELPERSDNIRILKWLPQSDLLKHPNVKLFITQGGLQSTDEAIIAGVPLLGMPMFADQWYNTELYLLNKIGVKVEMDTLSEENFLNGINTVINDKNYRKNIERLRSLIHDQPQTPLDRAIWWTEHLLRHGGGSHLRSPAASISWTQYLDIELLAVLATAALVAIGGAVFILYSLSKFVKGFSEVKVKTS